MKAVPLWAEKGCTTIPASCCNFIAECCRPVSLGIIAEQLLYSRVFTTKQLVGKKLIHDWMFGNSQILIDYTCCQSASRFQQHAK
ncbi:hypothetical protein CBW56_01710 [Denitratisoma oestradiolicum]|nr:hypothetical protein CBW56_01710 [Denitratisoma oestradiolicum]